MHDCLDGSCKPCGGTGVYRISENNSVHPRPCSICGGSGRSTKEQSYQAEGHPPQIDIGNGRTTKGHSYHLIPKVALDRLANRFELGEERKGDKAWNAASSNQDVLVNIPFIIERLNHVIEHAKKLQEKIQQSKPLDDDDDAGAISWGGAFLVCATDALMAERKEQDGNCGKTGI